MERALSDHRSSEGMGEFPDDGSAADAPSESPCDSGERKSDDGYFQVRLGLPLARGHWLHTWGKRCGHLREARGPTRQYRRDNRLRKGAGKTCSPRRRYLRATEGVATFF